MALQQQPLPTVENHFIAGLKTEYTGLNFPENAATDTQNCVYTLIGDVTRRDGINFENNFKLNNINVSGVARSSFRWLNAGGDGVSQILVQQIGNLLYFWKTSAATTVNPVSTTLLLSIIDITFFRALNNTIDLTQFECQYAIGNGYLFVFHPGCDSFYCIFSNGLVTGNEINVQIRDQIGILESGVSDNFRPNTLSNEHLYNLLNQGWTQGPSWSGNASYNGLIPLSNQSPSLSQLTLTLTNQSNTTSITGGSTVKVVINPTAGVGPDHNQQGISTLIGTVSNYVVGPPSTITINFFSNDHHELDITGFWNGGNFFQVTASVQLTLINQGFINVWKAAVGNYPSNSDIWWLYKDTTDTFNPSALIGNVQSLASPAPKGTFIYSAFTQDKSAASSVPNLTTVSTTARPSTGTFYQGRVWYAGVNAFFPASIPGSGDATNVTWTENIYFSQIVESPLNFGKCYQTNDPTSQNLFDILPTDGGVITIPGCGAIYKLFALRFGLLVFAANGVWFISGSTGIGFTASDFTVTKISNIQSISGTSFLEMQGFPMFWNQEGIYQVTPAQQPGSAHSPDIQLDVQNLCIGSILTYFNNVPLISKANARGDYDQLSYIVQWCFRSTNESGIVDRYNYDTILNYNVVTKSFYPFTLPTNSKSVINDIKYIQNPGGSGAPGPVLKYITSNGPYITFSEEYDTRFLDFFSENNQGYDFLSYFFTGFKSPGKFLNKFQTPYVYVFSRNPSSNSYGIAAVWDYAGSGLSGKWSTRQIRSNSPNNFTNMYHKIRLRGRGLAMQLHVTSISGKPFDIMGWSIWNEVNVGV
jgi:hypothetical protein